MNKEKKVDIFIEAHVENAEDAKELLDDLEALTSKYKTTTDLKIYQCSQESYTLI